MLTLKQAFLLLAIPAMLISLNSCSTAKEEFKVTFYLPDGKTDGVLPKFVSAYALQKYGVPVNADSVLAWTDELQRQYFGGVGVDCNLKIEDQALVFEPRWGASLVSKFSTITIPVPDIRDASLETFLLIDHLVVVNTVNGQFKFHVEAGSPDAEEICRRINDKKN